MIKNLISLHLISVYLTLGAVAQPTPTYQFIKKISLPGDGKWDYLKMDGERERLFVSHFDRVHIIDLKTEQPIGEKGYMALAWPKISTKATSPMARITRLPFSTITHLRCCKRFPLPVKSRTR